MIDTPLGAILVRATENGLTGLELLRRRPEAASRGAGAQAPAGAARHVRAAERALASYFDGVRDAFRELVLAPEGTAFQREVWRALRSIPYGETMSYGELARRIGRPEAMRAVGLANGRNPLPIVVPCHRVIGADGRLSGFGLGVDVKAWLLVHEGASAALRAPITAASRLRAAAAAARLDR